MRKISTMALMIVVAVYILPREAGAVDLTHSFVVGLDVGFDLDPDLFAWDALAEYHVTSNVAVGPLLTFGADNNTFMWGASGFAKYKANLTENENLKPYGLLGIGFLTVYQDVPMRRDWASDTQYLIPIGGGFEYWLNDRLAVGSNLLFNISDDIFFSLFFGARTRF